MANDSDVSAALDAIRELHGTQMLTAKDPVSGTEAPILAFPAGVKFFELKQVIDNWRTKPERHRGTTRLETLDSFIAFVCEFAGEQSRIYADDAEKELIAVFDHAQPGDGGQSFGCHRASYCFPISDEWTAWTCTEDAMIPQSRFAEFVEEQLLDIIDPSGAGPKTVELAAALGFKLASPQKMLELSRGLSVTVAAKVTNVQNLSTGESKISFSEEHAGDDGAPISVPQGFVIAIPVFKGGDVFQIPVRLRYKLENKQVWWTFALQREQRAYEMAMGEAIDRVRKETAIPVYRGTPATL